MYNLDNALKIEMNLSTLNQAKDYLTQVTTAMSVLEEQMKRTMQLTNNIKWQKISPMEIFNTSGIERYKSEINSLNTIIDKVGRNYSNMASKLVSMTKGNKPLLDYSAYTNISKINTKVSNLIGNLQNLRNIDISNLSLVNQAKINSEIETLRMGANEIIKVQNNLQNSIKSENLSGINSNMQSLNSIAEQLEIKLRSVRESINAMNSASWKSINTPQIFNTTGITRARQEFAALQSSATRVLQTQNNITQKAMKMKIIPPSAAKEIDNINTRINNLIRTIQMLEAEKSKLSRWDVNGINQYNSKIENLRNSLHLIEQEQQNINNAIKDNNIEQLNSSYQRLNSIIDGTEKNIRDNTIQQNNFNNAIKNGSNHARILSNTLGNVVNRYANIYMAFRAGKAGISATDTYINNSSRLALITSNLEEQKQLQNDIYKSAMRSRGVYNDMVSTIAKLGLLAPDAFANNDELVTFTELMNKSFKISGASNMERSAAMYQLTQAMASGRLQGDEFRSIIENAPMLANAISEYTGVGRKGLKELSREGAISAEIIKNSLFSVASEIEARYAKMPLTFGDIWNQIKSTSTILFESTFERINAGLNSLANNGFTQGIYEAISWVTIKINDIINFFERLKLTAGSSISVVLNSLSKAGNYLFSLHGLMGNFMNAINSFARSTAFQNTAIVLSNAAITIGESISWVINIVSSLNENFGWLLPTVVSVSTQIMILKSINSLLLPILSNVANVIYHVRNHTLLMAAATKAATFAQQGLNVALQNNPFAFVISAVLKTISVIYGLLAAIRAVNRAAGVAIEASSNIGGVEAMAFKESMKKTTGVDYSLTTAQQMVNLNKDYESQLEDVNNRINSQVHDITVLDKSIRDNNPSSSRNSLLDKIYDKLSENYRDNQKAQLNTMQKELNKLTSEKNLMEKQYNEQMNMLKDQDSQVKNALNTLKNPDFEIPEIPPIGDFGGIGNVGGGNVGDIGGAGNIGNIDNVGNVDKISDTVDITSEDLRYMRDIAEREAINEYTQKLVSPVVHITFTGDIKETANIDAINEAIKNNIISELNSGAENNHF